MYEHHSFRTDKISLEKVLQNKGLSIEEFKDKYVCIEDEKFAICIQKKHMELIKTEFDYFNSLSDRIKFSVFNSNIPYSSIPEFCSYLENKCINTLKQFLSDKTENIISLRIIVKAITEQPLYLVEALQQYSDTLPENDKYYFRHDLIYGKIQTARGEFTGFKKSLSKEIRLLSANDTEKLKKLYSGLFYFTEQFISDLKEHQLEFKFLDSPLFEVFFKEIIYFKSYYQSEFGEFHFPEILEIEKKRNTKTAKKFKTKNKTANKDSMPDGNEINKSLFRLELFNEKDSTKKPFLIGTNLMFLKKQLRRFIITNQYDKPKQKFDLIIDYNVIRYLFMRINSDLYSNGKRLNRQERDFIQFMMDFFKLPSNWNKKYINSHYKDTLNFELLKKYSQYLNK